MFNRLFALLIIVMLILFAGFGYILYQQHTEEVLPSWTNLEINETPNAARLNYQLSHKPVSSFAPNEPPPTDRWEYRPEIWQPAVTNEVVEIPLDELEFREVTTPDGKVHLVPFPNGSPHIEGGYISYPEPEDNDQLIAPKSYFVFENAPVPAGENLRDYQVKTLLSEAHGIPMAEVEARLKQGTLTYTLEPSNEDWVDSIGGEAEIENFLIEAGVSDTAIDQTLNSSHLLEGSTSSSTKASENQDTSTSHHEPSVEPPRALNENKSQVSKSNEGESNVEARDEEAQQLIDQYGTEEGLRRLREMDPEAARQFEQRHRPVPSHDVPDGGQSESGSKD